MKECFMKKQCRQAHQLYWTENVEAYKEVTNQQSFPARDWWG